MYSEHLKRAIEEDDEDEDREDQFGNEADNAVGTSSFATNNTTTTIINKNINNNGRDQALTDQEIETDYGDDVAAMLESEDGRSLPSVRSPNETRRLRELPPRKQRRREAETTALPQSEGLSITTSILSNQGWKLQVPLGTQHEADRWRSGEIAEVYEDTLRTLLRLQGEAIPKVSDVRWKGETDGDGADRSRALATTVGKTERAGRAAEVVENL